jgi:MarR family transcriptional regulator, organic hydroperoxide resistance regulator
MSIETQGPGTARAEVTAAADDSAPALNRDILDALTTLVKQAGATGQSIASGFGLAPHDLLAMFKLDGALPMKELAQRMGCDASFITTIADNLEKRGFLNREPGQRDRRVKNLVLTADGIGIKDRLMTQLAERMPWCYALDEEERRCFLRLVRKMVDTPGPGADAAGGGNCPGAGK